MEIIFVSGNENKLNEVRKILPEFEISNIKLDLVEIQSLDISEIVCDKAKRAYDELNKPVLVEDTEFCILGLNGLPGPFIKFFEKKLGNDAISQLVRNIENKNGISRTCVCYYDGNEFVTSIGEVKGRILDESVKGENVFGFDGSFVPEGYDKTFYELGPEIKNKISHRAIAFKKIKEKLNDYLNN